MTLKPHCLAAASRIEANSRPGLAAEVSSRISGGEGGIRTHGTREGSTVFETARFNRSRTSPHRVPLFSHSSPRAVTYQPK